MSSPPTPTVKLSRLLEVWESFSGWYWFVTEYHEGTLAFGLVRGWETEWGYFDLAELWKLQSSYKIWKVPKQNWALCPCVIDDAASCSRDTSVPQPRVRAKQTTLPARGTVPRRAAQTHGAAKADAGLHSTQELKGGKKQHGTRHRNAKKGILGVTDRVHHRAVAVRAGEED